MSSEDGEETWIEWFCGLQGHEMFCEVDRGYIEDGFNLYGLRQLVPHFSECLDIILDRIGPDDSDEDLSSASCELYGLIHARYIISNSGLEAMYHKYTLHEFGVCPRVHCLAQPVLPLGTRDNPKQDSVKMFCARCQDIYSPPIQPGQRSLDGAYFGTTFANLFYMTYEHLIPMPAVQRHIPKIFGFAIHQTSIYRRTRGSQQRSSGNGVGLHRDTSRSAESSKYEGSNKERRTSPVYSHARKAGNPAATTSTNGDKLENGSGVVVKKRRR
mmetsp:Transcript_51683/g.75636  ORF Transcript_51683/g.75636 Transcript_51683/m.75636 type:complete len:271 (-) Transcript_51683:494-1306(-)